MRQKGGKKEGEKGKIAFATFWIWESLHILSEVQQEVVSEEYIELAGTYVPNNGLICRKDEFEELSII